jgi:hypothetical protein
MAHRQHSFEFVTGCDPCGIVEADVRAISRAFRASAAWTLAAPRDFRLTAAQAAALRSNGRAWLAQRLVALSSGLARPLGTALATLGLAGLVVGSSGALIGASGAGDASREGAYGPAIESPVAAYLPTASGVDVTVEPPKTAPGRATDLAAGDARTVFLVGSAGCVLGGLLLIRGSQGNRTRRDTVGGPR